MQSQLIKGPEGQLEVIVETPVLTPTAIGIVCHPHPLYQGTMHNKVAYTLARSFKQADMIAIRFNFRGVGQSDGQYADGIGEVQDLHAVFTWAQEQWPTLTTNLAGFSFGAYVTLRFLQETRLLQKFQVQNAICVAPPVGRWDFIDLHLPELPVLIAQGLDDELVDAQAVRSWVQGQNNQPSYSEFPDTGHFFHGKLTTLKETLSMWLENSASRHA